MKRREIRYTVSSEEYEILQRYAVQESPSDNFGTVMRSLARDGLRFRAYLGGALEKIMLIGVAGTPAQDDIQNLAKCVLEQMKGE